MAGGVAEQISFGVERELEYGGHLTPAMHLVRLPRRSFASADETHIRIWGPAGDTAKTTFPSNRRSMVSAMAYCPIFSAVLTAEVDMTLKAYSAEKLEIMEVFSLEQARKEQGVKFERGHSNSKVHDLACLPMHSWVLLCGDGSCELWRLQKSPRRRALSVGRLEFHLQFEFVKHVVCAEAVLKAVVSPAEQRIVLWGPHRLRLFDMELNPLACYRNPHGSELVRCACVHVVSFIDTALLTGGTDGAVNYWNIQAKQLQSGAMADEADVLPSPVVAAPALGQKGDPSGAVRLPASMRLEHSFQGHLRPVEMVCFYHRLERNGRQRLAASFARDRKVKVWSLEQFSVVYTLDFNVLDSKASAFPLAPHFLAVSSAQAAGDSLGQQATVALVRFTAHLATPFATTNHSPVLQIAQPPVPPDLGPALEAARRSAPGVADAAVLVSEDMAIRIVDGRVAGLLSTLPPPPNSKVQVLKAFVCPTWQLLILWLSSEEIAVFFIPQPAKQNGQEAHAAEGDEGSSSGPGGDGRGTGSGSTTPLLVRRFSVLEVRAEVLDKDLSKEIFHSVALHHGRPLQAVDSLLHGGFDTRPTAPTEAPLGAPPDWFLAIGTKRGTLQAFRLADLLADLPIWATLSASLPPGAWVPPRRKRAGAPDRFVLSYINVDPRLAQIEKEHLEAMEQARLPGQRPFPRGAQPLRLHGRWRCHDYPIQVTESVGDRFLTVDAKRVLKIWKAPTMTCMLQMRLGEYVCHTLYLRVEQRNAFTREGKIVPPHEALVIAGLALGTASGGLQLVVAGDGGQDPETIQSHTTHADAVVQMDFGWPLNVFVSVGRDDTVKIWSHNLVLLREMVFPQRLTAVAFRRSLVMDAGAGHGDVLVGFAAHVEQVPLECWSRGIPPRFLGRNPERVANTEAVTNGKLLKRLQASDDIGDHVAYLHADQPEEALDTLEAHDLAVAARAFGLQEAGPDPFEDMKAMAAADAERQAREATELAKARLRGGRVLDFRGAPLFEVGDLLGRTWPESPRLAVEASEHERTKLFNQGDFRAITRCDPGYYDWAVHPSALVDAPRGTAIRGVAGAGDIALVTSLGIGHLRGEDEREGDAALDDFEEQCEQLLHKATDLSRPRAKHSHGQGRPPRGASAKDPGRGQKANGGGAQPAPAAAPAAAPGRRAAPASAALQVAGQIAAAGTPARQHTLDSLPSVPAPAPTRAPQPAAPTAPQGTGAGTGHPAAATGAGAAGGPSTTTVSDSRSGETAPTGTGTESEQQAAGGAAALLAAAAAGMGMDEAWRSLRIGRGLPALANASKPRAQAVANSEEDVAKMLKVRGHLVEAPEPEETNFLNRLVAKKGEWLYYPPDSAQEAAKRRTIKNNTTARARCGVATWTKNGRLVTMECLPPKEGLVPPGPRVDPAIVRLRHRVPMTRSEVTEQRLIEAALRGQPSAAPPLVLKSREYAGAQPEQPAPALLSPPGSARGSVAVARSDSGSSLLDDEELEAFFQSPRGAGGPASMPPSPSPAQRGTGATSGGDATARGARVGFADRAAELRAPPLSAR